MLCDSKSKFVELTLIIHYQLLIRSVLCFGSINEKHPQPDLSSDCKCKIKDKKNRNRAFCPIAMMIAMIAMMIAIVSFAKS